MNIVVFVSGKEVHDSSYCYSIESTRASDTLEHIPGEDGSQSSTSSLPKPTGECVSFLNELSSLKSDEVPNRASEVFFAVKLSTKRR